MNTPARTDTQKGVIALVLLALVFASMGIFARYLNTSFELFEQTYLRIGIAFVLGIIIFHKHLKWQRIKILPKKDIGVLVFRSVALYLAIVMFTEAILNATYGNAAFLSTLPLLPVFGYVFLKEKLTLKTLLYIGVGFIGVVLIAFKNFTSFEIGYGEVMSFLSMIFFDFSYIARRWQSDHLNNKESAVVMFAMGAVLLFVTSILLGESLPTLGQFTPLVILALLGSGLFNVANLYLTNYGFQHVKAGIAGNILSLESVFALAYSVFVFKEIPVAKELIGGVLILISVWLVNKTETE